MQSEQAEAALAIYWMLKMNIKKLTREGKIITIVTNEYPDKGFCFDIDEIIDKADLEAKIQSRIEDIKNQEQQEALWEDKFKTLK